MAYATQKFTHQEARIEKLKAVLQTMVDEAIELSESGDAGFWDQEKVPSMIASRAALKETP